MNRRNKFIILTILAFLVLFVYVNYNNLFGAKESVPTETISTEANLDTTVHIDIESVDKNTTTDVSTVDTVQEDVESHTTKVSFFEVFLYVLLANALIILVITLLIVYKTRRIANSIKIETDKDKMGMNIGSMGFGGLDRNMDLKINTTLPEITFDDVEGIPEVKKEAKNLVNYLKNPYKYKSIGARMPKGVILYGPPGTGKTLVAKAIAGTAGVPFLSVSGSDFMEMYVGVGARRVKQLFAEANRLAPCIVFIDEIDAIGGKRGESHSNEKDMTINAFLTELDGFNSNKGVMVIAATNRLDMLDPALIRAGRFDKHIAVGLPDKKERLSILKLYAKNKKLDETINLEVLASQTTGFSGAELESLLNEAALIAGNDDKKVISMKEIDNAFFKVVMKGDVKENQSYRDREELELVAWHEAGHALITKLLTKDEVTRVTILASTSGAGGVTFHNPPEHGKLYSKNDLKNRIAICYGGRAAEEILYKDKDKITIGASQDIKQASNLIKNYIMTYGMSERFGMLDIDVFEKQSISNDSMISEASKLAKEVYEYTLQTLKDNYVYLEQIAKELLEKENLLDEDIDRILGRIPEKKVISDKEDSNEINVELSC